MQHSISFDDVLILPRCSSVSSRNNVCIKPGTKFQLELSLPYMSAPMTTVTGVDLAISVAQKGGLPVIPRRQSVENQLNILREVSGHCVVATGLNKSRIDSLLENSVRCILVDVAFGANDTTIQTVKYIKNKSPDTFVIAGNTAVVEDAAALFNAGVDALRVGIGGGAACTTRIVTGVGVPTLQSVINAYKARELEYGRGCSKHASTPLIIADGGIRNPGDANKSLLAGADFVMMGSQLAGTMEAPGKVVSLNGVMYKPYAGMASASANPSSTFVEGDSGLVPITGMVGEVLDKYAAGLRSAMSYIGVSTMSELKNYVANTKLENRFTQVTFASLKESNTRLEK